MYRLRGASAAIREATPPVLTDAFALVTTLGGLPFLLVALSVLYWVDDRRATATVIGYTLVALAAVLTLKAWLAVPRPPASVIAVAEVPETHAFPSGHATSAGVVYGGLVLARGKLRDARFAVPALVVIALVGLSRVVIGVHYLGDVLAGYALAAVVLAGLRYAVGHRADRACLVAAAASVLGLVVTGGGTYAFVGLGASLGGAVAFNRVDEATLPRPSDVPRAVGFVAAGLAGVGALFYLIETVAVAPVAVAASAALVVGVVLYPRLLSQSIPG